MSGYTVTLTDAEYDAMKARIATLEAFLVKVLPAGIEDVCDECGGDLAKCKAENPDCYIAEARRLLPPPSETPAKPVLTGVDMASGPDRTIWYCNECGITDYPCNHAKSQADRGAAK